MLTTGFTNDEGFREVNSHQCSARGEQQSIPCILLEIVITRAAPAFHKLFMVMGCVFYINTVF